MATDVQIDSLSIEMTADFSKASRSITTLSKKIDKLSSSMNSLSTASGALNTFRDLNATMQSIATTSTELNKAVKTLNTSFGRMIPSTGIKNAEALNNTFEKLTKSLEKAGSGKIKTFVGHTKNLNMHLPRLGSYAGTAAVKIDGLGKAFTRALIGAKALISGARMLWRVLSGGIELASDLTEVQNVVDKAFGTEAGKLEEMAKTSIQKLGMSELTAKQIASRYQAMGSAMGISNRAVRKASAQIGELRENYNSAGESVADMSLNLTKLSADMASFYNVGIEDVAQDLQAIFTGQTRPLRQYGLDLTQATLKEWALKQGIEADIESMSQAEKTMLRYQYVMQNTKMVQGDFLDTADTWANQIKILKQQFEALGAVIGGGLINALKPFVQAMNAALSGIIDFAEKVVNALGKIFGWVIEITPSDMPIDDAMIDVLDDQTSGLEDVADAADDAAKSIEKAKEEEEEYQRTVLGFDELNKLNAEKEKKEDEPGASNKGNSAVGNPLKNLDLSKASAGAGDVKMSINKIKSLYESEIDTLYDLGKYISETLTKALNGIQWDKVYEGARGFGKGLASFLNGLITPDLFGALGRTIANSLNTALQFLNSFGKEFDFKNFGNALKAGLDALLANFNWDLAKDTARTWAKGMADGLNEFINPSTFAALGRTIAEGINTALDFIDEFSRDFDFKNLGDSIENGLIALLGTIDWKTAYSAADGFGTGLADFLNELITPNLFDEVGKTVASVMNTALHFLDSFGETFDWKNFGTSLATGVNTFLDTFDWKLLGTSINTWVNGVFDAIESFLATTHWETLFDGVKTTLSQISFASIGANIIDTLWAGINGSRMGVIDKKKILESFSELETTLRTISGFVFTNLDNFYNNFLVPVGNWVLGDGLTEFTRIINDVLSGIDWDALNSGLSGMYSVAKDFTIGVGKGILTFLDGLQKAWNILVAPFINLIADALGKLFDAIDGVNGSVVESIGKGVGVLLGAVVAYKIGTSITTGIAKLGTSLGTLIPAIVAHPALAIAACGAAIGVAIYDIVNGSKELKSQTAKNIDATASAIDALSTTLSNTDISVEADYKYIKEILDKYMTLNSELLTKGSLSEGDQSMFAFYHDELANYAPDIVQYIGEVGTAYEGTRTELEKLLEKQHEQALFESYVQVWKDANTELQNQRVNIEKIRLDMAQSLLPVLQEVKDKTGIDVDLNYSSEDFQSLLDFLHDGTFNSDLLTDAMKNLVNEGFGNAYTATLDLMGVENKQGDAVKDLWDKYDDGQISLSNAEYMLGLVEDMINNLGIDTGNLSTTTDSVMDSIEKRYGDAKEVISDKTNGMYTDAKARFDDINRTIEEHGTTGVEKIKQFPWSSPMGEVLDDMGTVVDQKTDTLSKALEKFGDDAVGYLGGNGLNGTGRGVTSRRIQSLNAGWDLTITKGIKDPVQTALEIKGAVSGFFDKIGDSTIGGYLKGVADKVPEVKSEFESLPGKLKDKMGNVFNFFKPAGEDTIGGLSQGEKDTRDDFLGLYPVLIDDARDKFKDVKHVFELQGQLITIGLKGGVNSKRDDLLTAISTLESDMKGKFTQFVYDGWRNIGSNLMNSMNSGIISVTETLKSTISSVQGAMYNQINNQFVYDSWWRVGHDLMQTLVNGINSVRPHIPVPHFDVITGYSGTTPYPIVRNLGWYAKGGLAYDASVIGVGEAGNEAVIPLENPGVMQAIAEAIVTAMPDAVTRGMVAANVGNDNRPIVVNATLRTENNEVLARAVAQGQRQIDYRQNAVARY